MNRVQSKKIYFQLQWKNQSGNNNIANPNLLPIIKTDDPSLITPYPSSQRAWCNIKRFPETF